MSVKNLLIMTLKSFSNRKYITCIHLKEIVKFSSIFLDLSKYLNHHQVNISQKKRRKLLTRQISKKISLYPINPITILQMNLNPKFLSLRLPPLVHQTQPANPGIEGIRLKSERFKIVVKEVYTAHCY